LKPSQPEAFCRWFFIRNAKCPNASCQAAEKRVQRVISWQLNVTAAYILLYMPADGQVRCHFCCRASRTTLIPGMVVDLGGIGIAHSPALD
jgi:hypothetical protein